MSRQPRPGGRFQRGRHYGRRTYIRKNERIRVREVRLIGPDAKQIGIVSTTDAMKIARDHGLDLVEIAPTAKPPVCRVLDFGKYKYELSKKSKERSHHISKIKEVKFRVRIEKHDYETKLRRAEEFLDKGNKVKLTLSFRGRELEHKELGYDVIQRAVQELAHIGVSESQPRQVGRNITLVLAPLPANKRKLKLTQTQTEEKPAKPKAKKNPDKPQVEGEK